MLLTLVGKVLSRGEGEARRDDAFNGRVVSQIQEETHILHRAIFFKVLLVV